MRTLQGHPEDIRVRCLIRNQLDEAGAQDIYGLLRGFKRPDIDRQINDMQLERRSDMAELEDMGELPKVGSHDDPLEVFRGVLASVEGTKARDVFVGSLRSLLLIKPDDDIRLRYHQILNKVVSSLVANDAVGMEEFNFATLTGSNVNQLVGQFEEQERLERARARAAEMEATAQELALQKAALEEQLALGGSGQVQQLKDKLAATEQLLKGSRLATQKLQTDMDEMRESYEKRIAALEAKIMELFAMLKENRQLDGVIANKDGSVDRQQLLDSLERQEEIRKTIAKLEGAHRKQRKRRSGRLPVGRSGFDDDTDEEDVAPSPTASISSALATTPRPPAKSKARRSDVKSGSQFVDAEDEIVREHIEASIVAGLNSSVSPRLLLSTPFTRGTDSSPVIPRSPAALSRQRASKRSPARRRLAWARGPPAPHQLWVDDTKVAPRAALCRGAQGSAVLSQCLGAGLDPGHGGRPERDCQPSRERLDGGDELDAGDVAQLAQPAPAEPFGPVVDRRRAQGRRPLDPRRVARAAAER